MFFRNVQSTSIPGRCPAKAATTSSSAAFILMGTGCCCRRKKGAAGWVAYRLTISQWNGDSPGNCSAESCSIHRPSRSSPPSSRIRVRRCRYAITPSASTSEMWLMSSLRNSALYSQSTEYSWPQLGCMLPYVSVGGVRSFWKYCSAASRPMARLAIRFSVAEKVLGSCLDVSTEKVSRSFSRVLSFATSGWIW